MSDPHSDDQRRLAFPARAKIDIDIDAYLPVAMPAPLPVPGGLVVDILVPVNRGLSQTRACLQSVLADPARLPGALIVIDDGAQEPALSTYLDGLNDRGAIRLMRNRRRLGFVGAVDRAMEAATPHDVVLLTSPTRVSPGWCARLAAHAYAAERIGSVSPFSNSATVCGYPSEAGGELPFGFDTDTIDAVARVANAGRAVEVPAMVGMCLFVRRACLNAVGAFQARPSDHFGSEASDFCQRARAAGWTHRLACDVFVCCAPHQRGMEVGASSGSFAATDASEPAALEAGFPEAPSGVDRAVYRAALLPARIALTVALMRRSGWPVLVQITHGLGGGIAHHLADLEHTLRGRAHLLVLGPDAGDLVLTMPVPGAAAMRLVLPVEALGKLVRLLRTVGVRRVHLHHVLDWPVHAGALIAALGVPFDITVHDYFPICPQITLLPAPDEAYCGEPDAAGCNTCIAHRPSYGATDILAWRATQAWMLRDAARVLCPSADVATRLSRYVPSVPLLIAPHEPEPHQFRTITRRRPQPAAPLRVLLLGVLAAHKGAATVASVLEAADPTQLSVCLIGYTEQDLPFPAQDRLAQTGPYQHPDLAKRIAAAGAHVAWFPAPWPETYSYTLSAALAAGLPIVASDLGAFADRLEGRPATWLVSADAAAVTWLEAFARVRAELIAPTASAPRAPRPRRPVPPFYPDAYLAPLAAAPPSFPAAARAPPRVLILPERLESGIFSPCAYIRLLLPFDHPTIAAGFECRIVSSVAEARHMPADLIVTQRHALEDQQAADALIAHARACGARLAYDLDDDLITIDAAHPEAARLGARVRIVKRLAAAADVVWVSTDTLSTRLAEHGLAEHDLAGHDLAEHDRAGHRPTARVVANGLDERLWRAHRPMPPRGEAVRVLIMGTATHIQDIALLEVVFPRLAVQLGERLQVEVVGMMAEDCPLPAGVRRLAVPPQAGRSYPGFINWITRQPGWHVGLAPLADTRFNGAKSAIKTLDYAALGLAVLASDVPAYRGSLADAAAGQPGGLLVANTPTAWVEAIARVVRNARLRQALQRGADQALAGHTLTAQADARRQAIVAALATPRREAAIPPPRPRRRRTAITATCATRSS